MKREKYSKSDLYHLYGNKRNRVPFDEYGEYAQGDLDTGFRHSSFYHAFFEGYTEVRTKNKKGGYKIERYYTAPYISQKLLCGQRIRNKCLYLLLFLLAGALFFWCMVQRTGSNTCAYVAAPGFVSAIFLLLFAAKLFSYAAAKEKMTLYEYKSNCKGIQTYARLCGVGLATTAVMILLYLSRKGDMKDLRNGILLLIASACFFFIDRKEKKIVYVETENRTQVPEGGVTIR